jgi:hypothetical protein
VRKEAELINDESLIARTRRGLSRLSERLFGQHITVYPTYAYRDRKDAGEWCVPLRVWVHDNRDTPGVGEAIERLAAAHFERDLERPLTSDEAARLEERLACFIADDKSGEKVELVRDQDRLIALGAGTHPANHVFVLRHIHVIHEQLGSVAHRPQLRRAPRCYYGVNQRY